MLLCVTICMRFESFCEIGSLTRTNCYLPVQCIIRSNIFGCFLGTALSLRSYAFENQLVIIELRHDGKLDTSRSLVMNPKECTKSPTECKVISHSLDELDFEGKKGGFRTGALQLNSPKTPGGGGSSHPIVGLNPYQNKWVIKARCMNKGSIRNYNNAKGPGKLFNFEVSRTISCYSLMLFCL